MNAAALLARNAIVARPMPFEAPVVTIDLTMAAAQLLPSLPAGRHLLGDGAKKHPRQPASDQWAEHRHDRVAPIRGPLAF